GNVVFDWRLCTIIRSKGCGNLVSLAALYDYSFKRTRNTHVTGSFVRYFVQKGAVLQYSS
ncbi:hypothetical protein, partial [Xylanibacillus composti]|uniref:hypothetical protein n=1 Tax=Xylanibacillus composti TaxID=1572762 RepID=UPI001BCF61F3